MLHRTIGEHTLGAVEGAVLRALGEGTVEERGESGLLRVTESIVHPDELLEALATSQEYQSAKMFEVSSYAWRSSSGVRRRRGMGIT